MSIPRPSILSFPSRAGWLVAILFALVPSPADAHRVGLSGSSWSADAAAPGILRVKVSLAAPELLALAPALDADQDGHLGAPEIDAAAPLVASLLAELEVRVGEDRCVATVGPSRLAEDDGVDTDASFTCPTAAHGDLHVRVGFLARLAPGHRHLLDTQGGSGPRLLSAQTPAATLLWPFAPQATATVSPPADFDFLQVFKLGVEHIITGVDHLVFLFGLLLVGGRLSALLGVVTAFTVAHSLTLGAAALGLLSPPPAVVEAAIAASILYVGVENLLVPEPRHRWRLTFVFGLIHGFGFAGALAEVGLRDHVVPTLLAFNLGVEAGQLGVLAVVLPLLLLARRSAAFQLWGVRLASVGICLAGTAWLIDRTLG